MLLIEHQQNFQGCSPERKEKICHVERIIRIGCNVKRMPNLIFQGRTLAKEGLIALIITEVFRTCKNWGISSYQI